MEEEFVVKEKTKKINAIILAAGLGMRMVPVTLECPKALLKIKGEVLVERLINQLHEAGIYKIKIVVGFMKEKFEYLIDKYNVDIIVNSEYRTKNNLFSLNLVRNSIHQTYIIPGDIWCKKNPFIQNENQSWYLISAKKDSNSYVVVTKRYNIRLKRSGEIGNHMIGISYISEDIATDFCNRLKKLAENPLYYTSFWEAALFEKKHFLIHARVDYEDSFIEINTLDDLINFDQQSDNLNTKVLNIICKYLLVSSADICNVKLLKKGMTNRSFIFTCKNKKYIMRIPGEGTQELIDRRKEAATYLAIRNLNLSDEVIYIDPDMGYKLSCYLENSRTCNPASFADVKASMSVLRKLHQQTISVDHVFDVFEQISFYESLMKKNNNSEAVSMYADYMDTKISVYELKKYIDENAAPPVLCHIDPVPDNFLFIPTQPNSPRLIDWEYSGMADYHIDIAMFCIYALYNKNNIDNTISAYYSTDICNVNPSDKILIYCYVAACGLLWSNWCEYKQSFGVDFGKYAIYQYRYAKDYSQLAKKCIMALGEFGDVKSRACGHISGRKGN